MSPFFLQNVWGPGLRSENTDVAVAATGDALPAVNLGSLVARVLSLYAGPSYANRIMCAEAQLLDLESGSSGCPYNLDLKGQTRVSVPGKQFRRFWFLFQFLDKLTVPADFPVSGSSSFSGLSCKGQKDRSPNYWSPGKIFA